MAHGLIGHIGEFHSDSEDWISYSERLELYFVANGIEDATKRQAILLSVCGPSTYQLIRDLLSPTKPTDKSFAELVTLVKEHQQPAPSFIVQRYNFNTRVQQPGETISAFVAQLRKIARDCRYGETLEDMLRDRLVCGCRDHRLQCKLLSDPALTFEKAMTIAKSNETAEQGARDLAGGAVHRFSYNRWPNPQPPEPRQLTPQPPTLPCSHCGASHSPSTCKFKTATCHYCGKIGHLASVCRKKARDRRSAAGGGGESRNHQLEAVHADESEDMVGSLYYSPATRSRPLLPLSKSL